MFGMFILLVMAFAAGMVALDLLMRLSGGKIVLPENSFLVRFWRERKDEDPHTLCEVILLLTTTTAGNIIGVMLVLVMLAGAVIAPVALVKGAMEFGFEQSSDPKVVAGIVVLAVVLMVALLAVWVAVLVGTINVGERAEEKFKISRVIIPVLRVIMWPFRTAATIYRIVRDRACPVVTITAEG